MGKKDWVKWVVGGILASCAGLFYWFFIRPRLGASSGIKKTEGEPEKITPLSAEFKASLSTAYNTIYVYPEVILHQSGSYPVVWYMRVEVDGNVKDKKVTLDKEGDYTESIEFNGLKEGDYTVKVFMTLDNNMRQHLEWSHEFPPTHVYESKPPTAVTYEPTPDERTRQEAVQTAQKSTPSPNEPTYPSGVDASTYYATIDKASQNQPCFDNCRGFELECERACRSKCCEEIAPNYYKCDTECINGCRQACIDGYYKCLQRC